jgi:hypothetical protein
MRGGCHRSTADPAPDRPSRSEPSEPSEPGAPGAPGAPVKPDTSITARSPLRWNGAYGEPGHSPVLGRDTDQILTEVLGLSAPQLAGLHDRGVI